MIRGACELYIPCSPFTCGRKEGDCIQVALDRDLKVRCCEKSPFTFFSVCHLLTELSRKEESAGCHHRATHSLSWRVFHNWYCEASWLESRMKKKTDLKTCVMKDLVSEDWNCCFFVREFYCILTIKTNLPRNPPHQNGLWKVTERKFSCLLTHPLMSRVCRNVNMQTFPQSAMKEASAQLAPIGRPSRPFTRFPALYPSEHRVYSQQ